CIFMPIIGIEIFWDITRSGTGKNVAQFIHQLNLDSWICSALPVSKEVERLKGNGNFPVGNDLNVLLGIDYSVIAGNPTHIDGKEPTIGQSGMVVGVPPCSMDGINGIGHHIFPIIQVLVVAPATV